MILQDIYHTLLNIKRNRAGLIIAILGLAVGMLAVCFTAVYCIYYFSYDKAVSDSDQWYRLRLTTYDPVNGETRESGFFLQPASIIIKDIPEIKEYLIMQNSILELNLTCDGKRFPVNDLCYTTSNFPKHYNLKMIYGKRDSLLADKKNIILSRSFAEQYFGKENPVGKKVYAKTFPRFIIAGVFEDLPQNLHLRSNVYAPIISEETTITKPVDYYLRAHFRVRIPNAKDVPKVEQALNKILAQNPLLHDTQNKITVSLDPITKIHFIPGLFGDESVMKITNVYAILALGILFLLVSLLNFLNLVILSWQKREKEFAIRKSVGALKKDIFKLLFTEYTIYFIISLLIALIFYILFLNLFGTLAGIELKTVFQSYGLMLTAALIIVLSVCILAGISVSLHFAGAVTQDVEKQFRRMKTGIRNLLYVQLTIGFLFISLSLIVAHQYRNIINHNPGFEINNTFQYKYITLIDSPSPNYYDSNTLRDRIRSLPGIKYETATNFSVVTDKLDMLYSHFAKGNFVLKDGNNSKIISSYIVSTTPDFFGKRKIKLLKGSIPEGDKAPFLIVNETFAKKFFAKGSLADKVIDVSEDENSANFLSITGVVDDSWFFPAHIEMVPFIYTLNPMMLQFFQVTYLPENKRDVKHRLDDLFSDVSSIGILGYSSVDVADRFKSFYHNDTVFVNISVLYAVITALLSLLGIYAVSSLQIFSQMKEIAIRKVCGATFKDLILLYGKSYLLLFIITGAIGLICSYNVSLMFLDRFKLSLTYPWYMFPLTALIVFIIVFLPLYLNIRKANRTDPNYYLQSL